MINDTGEFYEDENDKGELAEIERRKTDALQNLDKLKDLPIKPLEMKCLECKGAKLMSYRIGISKNPPKFLAFWGFKPVIKWHEEKGVPCRRCGGSGLEKLSTDVAGDNAAAEA